MGKVTSFSVEDKVWEQIAQAGALPNTRAVRNQVEDLIAHHRLSKAETALMPSTPELRNSMRKIGGHATGILRELERYPGIMARLAGVVATVDDTDRILEQQLRQVAKLLIRAVALDQRLSRHTTSDVLLPGRANTLPHRKLFISSLLNFWRFTLERKPRGRLPKTMIVDAGRDYPSTGRPSLNRFLMECVTASGEDPGDEQSFRRDLSRVRERMDKNEAADLGWVI